MKKRGNDVGITAARAPALPSPSSEFLRNRFSHKEKRFGAFDSPRSEPSRVRMIIRYWCLSSSALSWRVKSSFASVSSQSSSHCLTSSASSSSAPHSVGRRRSRVRVRKGGSDEGKPGEISGTNCGSRSRRARELETHLRCQTPRTRRRTPGRRRCSSAAPSSPRSWRLRV